MGLLSNEVSYEARDKVVFAQPLGRGVLNSLDALNVGRDPVRQATIENDVVLGPGAVSEADL